MLEIVVILALLPVVSQFEFFFLFCSRCYLFSHGTIRTSGNSGHFTSGCDGWGFVKKIHRLCQSSLTLVVSCKARGRGFSATVSMIRHDTSKVSTRSIKPASMLVLSGGSYRPSRSYKNTV
jgi:hypothetical protein